MPLITRKSWRTCEEGSRELGTTPEVTLVDLFNAFFLSDYPWVASVKRVAYKHARTCWRKRGDIQTDRQTYNPGTARGKNAWHET